MGAFYNCICIPGDRTDAVRRALDRWLVARGYEESKEPVLFDLDAASERSAFLVWNERWTLVFYSHFDEERRLIRELQTDDGLAPLLYVWVWDSDVWGWDLFDADGFAGSFSSKPGEHRSFEGPETELVEERPPADAEEACRALGLDPGLEEEFRDLARRRSAFEEEICRELCLVLGAEPAASSYDELETGRAGGEALEGWEKAQVVYFHRDVAAAELGELDLHAVEVETTRRPSRMIELPAELLGEMERLRKKAQRTMFWIRPLGALARWWRRLREALTPASRAEPGEPESHISLALTQTASRHTMLNERHGVMIILPHGVEALPTSGKPSAVFSFQAGQQTVRCTARRLRHLSEALRPPGPAEVMHDETFFVGKQEGPRAELPARHLRYRLTSRHARERGPFLDLQVVQTYRALYVFHHRFAQLDPESEAAIRAAVRSFHVLDESGRRFDESIDPDDTIVV